MDKISKDAAEHEFGRLVDSWELDGDTSSMDDEDRDSFEALKRRVVLAICKGRLSIEDDGTVSYELLAPKVPDVPALSFRVPTGSAVLSWDKYKERQSIHKLNAFMGEMSGQSPAVFASMDGRDLKIVQALAQLFLGS